MTVNEDSISEGDEFAKDKRMKKTLLLKLLQKNVHHHLMIYCNEFMQPLVKDLN